MEAQFWEDNDIKPEDFRALSPKICIQDTRTNS